MSVAYKFLIVLIVTVLCLSLFVYLKAINYWNISFDGYLHLNFLKNHYPLTTRSPILAYILIPEVLSSRFEMILFHLGIAVILYFIIKELTKDEFISFFSSLIYGACWWFLEFTILVLPDLPALFFLLIALLLVVKERDRKGRGGRNDHHLVLSSVFLGIATLLRPYYILIFILVSFYFLRDDKRIWKFLATYFIIVVVLELILDFSFLGKFYYSIWELFKVNFIHGEFRMYNIQYLNLDFLRDVLMGSNPITTHLPRYILVTLIPLSIIFFSIKAEKSKNLNFYRIMSIFLIIYVGINLIKLSSLDYPRFRPDILEYPERGNITTNNIHLSLYFTGNIGNFIFLENDTFDLTLYTAIKNANKNEYVLFFPTLWSDYIMFPPTGRLDKNVENEIISYFNKNFILLGNSGGDLPVYIYKNPNYP